MEEDGLEATYTLTIKDAVLEDAGTFELSCQNRVGHTERQGTLAVITEEPSFPKPLADITTTLGATATFEAVVAGVPKPTVEWYQGDKALAKGKRRLLEEEVTQEGTVYKMTVRDIVMKDFGDIVSTLYILFFVFFHSLSKLAILFQLERVYGNRPLLSWKKGVYGGSSLQLLLLATKMKQSRSLQDICTFLSVTL